MVIINVYVCFYLLKDFVIIIYKETRIKISISSSLIYVIALSFNDVYT